MKNIIVIIFIMLFLTACENLGYLSQSVSGQLSIWKNETSIDKILSDDSQNISNYNKNRLAYLKAVLNFAYRNIGLPNNGSYTKFVQLEDKFVVYNIIAAQPLKLAAKSWCYPIIGCQQYRGYFNKLDAQQYAQTLENEYDVRIGGVSAYSTLGFFKDPVLSSFFNYEDTELASLIFHELSHQIFYIKDDTMFNESFATAVEIIATEKWIIHWQKLKNQGYLMVYPYHETLQNYKTSLVWDQKVLNLIKNYQSFFKFFYHVQQSNKVAESQILEQKSAMFNEFKDDYYHLKSLYPHNNDWDKWFERDLNNADLISIADYYGQVDAFIETYHQCQQDMTQFFQFVKQLAKQKKMIRDQMIQSQHRCNFQS